MAGEMMRLEEQLRRALDGEAWHGPSVLEVLAGVSAEQASSHPIPGSHSIWELVLHRRRLRPRSAQTGGRWAPAHAGRGLAFMSAGNGRTLAGSCGSAPPVESAAPGSGARISGRTARRAARPGGPVHGVHSVRRCDTAQPVSCRPDIATEASAGHRLITTTAAGRTA